MRNYDDMIRIPQKETRGCGARNCGDNGRTSGLARKRDVRRDGGYVPSEPDAVLSS